MTYPPAHGFGWVPDPPDCRDHLFSNDPTVKPKPATLTGSVDLRELCPPVVHQGRINSCSAHAAAAAFAVDLAQQGLDRFEPSRLFIYYNSRFLAHRVSTDSGATIRDSVKAVTKYGVCKEDSWPYIDSPPLSPGGIWPHTSPAGQRPPCNCFTEAQNNRAISYRRLAHELAELKLCLYLGRPFLAGFSVFQGFFDARESGAVPMPEPQEQKKGTHAALVVGYNDIEERFKLRNSWGPEWGNEGYFTLPYEYLLKRGLAADFWTIRTVS